MNFSLEVYHFIHLLLFFFFFFGFGFDSRLLISVRRWNGLLWNV